MVTSPAHPRAPGGKGSKSGGPVAAERIEDLAAASRILAAQGVVDGFGHVSMRHPSAPERYLMARSIAPALVTPTTSSSTIWTAIRAMPAAAAVFSSASSTAKSTRRGPISTPSFTAIRRR